MLQKVKRLLNDHREFLEEASRMLARGLSFCLCFGSAIYCLWLIHWHWYGIWALPFFAMFVLLSVGLLLKAKK